MTSPLATFIYKGSTKASTRIGVVCEDQIVDLAVAVPSLPREMTALLAAGGEALRLARAAITGATARIPLNDVKLAAPVLRPPKFLVAGGVVRIAMERIGSIENRVIPEPDTAFD